MGYYLQALIIYPIPGADLTGQRKRADQLLYGKVLALHLHYSQYYVDDVKYLLAAVYE